MSAHPGYNAKAQKYARYRWEYAPEAVQAVFQTANIGTSSVIADIGAGTGKFSRHFIGRVRTVYAVEPDADMRRMAEEIFRDCPDCVLLDGSAEAVPLPEGVVDLIAVAQAIHWFDPAPSRKEFIRILKPSGWLALVRNYGINLDLNVAIEKLIQPGRFRPAQRFNNQTLKKLADFYFGGSNYQEMVFPFWFRQDWLAFLGALTTTPGTLDEGHPDFPEFARAAQEVFMRFSQGGLMEVHGETELLMGRPE